ncbi:uncharacterized protein LOC143216539 [Lasioglossum baleicum]|uniref:uncharacterized protein LOC143216539 n=1 Tax=Lasioglossum baleicum TaxID=434251 RepID=UPI003FCD0B82
MTVARGCFRWRLVIDDGCTWLLSLEAGVGISGGHKKFGRCLRRRATDRQKTEKPTTVAAKRITIEVVSPRSAFSTRFTRFVSRIEQVFKLRSRSPYRRHDERKQRSSPSNCPLRGKTLIKEAPAPRIKVKIPELESGTGEFLIDGGASVNLVVLDVLGKGAEIVSREEIEITGLTANPIRTLGTTILHIHEAPAFFYVVKHLAIEADGLIGSPFLKQEEAEISYYHGTMVLKDKPTRPIRFSNYQLESEMPTKHRIDARSSQQIAIRITNPKVKEGYLPRVKTHEKLYIGEAAVLNDKGKCHVMATNTSEEILDVEINLTIIIKFIIKCYKINI